MYQGYSPYASRSDPIMAVRSVNNYSKNNVSNRLNATIDIFLKNLKPGQAIGPYSIFSIFHPLLLASNGQTLKEIKSLLGVNNENLVNVYNELFEIDDQLKKTKEFETYTGIFIKDTFRSKFKKSFIRAAKKPTKGKNFDINVFAEKEVVSTINKKVSNVTHGLINKLLTKDMVTARTIAILVNAIYFMSKWKTKFNKSYTEEQYFAAINKKTKVKLMYNPKINISYYEDYDCQFVSLPYENNVFAMGVVLSKSNDKLKKLVNTNTFMKCINNSRRFDVKLYLPKFEQKTRKSLVKEIMDSGMKTIFDEYSADFSKMVSLDATENVYVSEVIHECVVKVDEETTEAAAATAVVMRCRNSASVKIPEIKYFRADHTFTYFIYHIQTNAILFTGIYDGE